MKNKQQKATALTYDNQLDEAPKVTATGRGLIAENIINKAQEHDVPIVEDESLAELLAELNVNEKIPEELYMAVAEVFAFIYQVDKKMGTFKK